MPDISGGRVFAIGKEGGKEGLGAIAQRDACREEKEQGCLPPRHAAVFLLLFACQIKCHRQEEKRHAEMVIHKGDEQYVGKGKSIAVSTLLSIAFSCITSLKILLKKRVE